MDGVGDVDWGWDVGYGQMLGVMACFLKRGVGLKMGDTIPFANNDYTRKKSSLLRKGKMCQSAFIFC